MKVINSLLFVLTIVVLGSCGPNLAEDPTMQKAYSIFEEAAKAEKEVEQKMEELVQIKNNTNIAGRELSEEEMNRIKKIEELEESFKAWQDNHPDVPGFDHAHTHDGKCNHGPKLDLLPDDWVRVQEEFRDNIMVIKKDVEMIL